MLVLNGSLLPFDSVASLGIIDKDPGKVFGERKTRAERSCGLLEPLHFWNDLLCGLNS